MFPFIKKNTSNAKIEISRFCTTQYPRRARNTYLIQERHNPIFKSPYTDMTCHVSNLSTHQRRSTTKFQLILVSDSNFPKCEQALYSWNPSHHGNGSSLFPLTIQCNIIFLYFHLFNSHDTPPVTSFSTQI